MNRAGVDGPAQGCETAPAGGITAGRGRFPFHPTRNQSRRQNAIPIRQPAPKANISVWTG